MTKGRNNGIQKAETKEAADQLMPVVRGQDSDGPFYRWGQRGKKYRYTAGSDRSRRVAREKAAAQGRAVQRKAPKSDTPAKPAERRRGSSRNPAGSARGTRGGIRVSDETRKSLRTKVTAHNEEHGEKKGKRGTLGLLLAVCRRGAGAFSSSHSPRVRSRNQWAMARVNAFLHIVRTGRPRNPKYKGDNDLLPKDHPRKTGR